jgi:hypothetical protein
VSCPSATACTAVGNISLSVFGDPAAAHWDGTTWSLRHMQWHPALPRSIVGPDFDGVSCSSTTACIAVGGQELEYANLPLAERWNGRRWSVAFADYSPSSDYLYDVSCASNSACMVVGREGSGRPLAMRWSGLAWSTEPGAAPSGSSGGAFYGVWCGSRVACTAVGSYSERSSAVFPLVEGWDGVTWSTESVAKPAGAESTSLRSVSCRTVSACVAVGSITDHAHREHLLVESRVAIPPPVTG